MDEFEAKVWRRMKPNNPMAVIRFEVGPRALERLGKDELECTQCGKVMGVGGTVFRYLCRIREGSFDFCSRECNRVHLHEKNGKSTDRARKRFREFIRGV